MKIDLQIICLLTEVKRFKTKQISGEVVKTVTRFRRKKDEITCLTRRRKSRDEQHQGLKFQSEEIAHTFV